MIPSHHIAQTYIGVEFYLEHLEVVGCKDMSSVIIVEVDTKHKNWMHSLLAIQLQNRTAAGEVTLI